MLGLPSPGGQDQFVALVPSWAGGRGAGAQPRPCAQQSEAGMVKQQQEGEAGRGGRQECERL